jgi:hypothetical protein
MGSTVIAGQTCDIWSTGGFSWVNSQSDCSPVVLYRPESIQNNNNDAVGDLTVYHDVVNKISNPSDLVPPALCSRHAEAVAEAGVTNVNDEQVIKLIKRAHSLNH